MKKQILILFALALSHVVAAQDTLQRSTMKEVSITAAKPSDDLAHLHVVRVVTKEAIGAMPVHTVADLLEQLPGVDLRSRGTDGTQADLAMRGGTFDQVLVLLNGVNITDPHTGHYNMDLPVDLAMVDRIEVLQGTALSNFGLSAFCGAINIVTGEGNRPATKIGLSGGSFATWKGFAGTTQQVGGWRLTASASANSSEGYMHNTDYGYGNLFLQARHLNGRGDSWNLQLGGQLKNYGANAFYSLAYKEQYEKTRTLLASATRERHLGNWRIDYAAFARWHYDCFELFRDGTPAIPAWYKGHNYHISNVEGGHAKASLPWSLGRTTAGVEVRNEHISSNVLGDLTGDSLPVPFTSEQAFFLYAKNRTNINYFVEHNLYRESWSASIGLSGNHNTIFGDGFCYSANGNWRLGHGLQFFGSAGRSLRLPTFTDLYYHSATQQANPDLKPETSLNGELSLHWDNDHLSARLTGYYRHGTNVIDWIRRHNESVWRSANHTEVDALGVESEIAYRSAGIVRRAELAFSYCALDKEAGDYQSEYALDYLRNKLSLNLSLRPLKRLSVDILCSHQQRKGSYADLDGNLCCYDPVVLLNAKIGYDWRLLTLYVEGANLLGSTYFDYGGILQPGTSAMAGMTITF